MKKILILVLALIATSATFAQLNEKADFSDVCSSGQVLYYKIVDDGEVNLWFHSQYADMLGGYIRVPRSVKYQGRNYIVTGVADNALANCIRVQGIELPNSVYYIGDMAFYKCTDLSIVYLPKSLTSIGSQAFEGCTALVDFVMPHSVTEMGEGVFRNCSNVRHFVISHSLTAIPEDTFNGCSSATDYIIPDRIATIGCNAFAGNTNLRSITFFGTVPPTPDPECGDAFNRDIVALYVIKGFDTYKASTIWGQFTIRQL